MSLAREDLIKLPPDEAYSQLLKLWNGELNALADCFYSETGEDYEQCLINYLTESKYQLDHQNIHIILARFKGDPQFYELAHFLISSVFNSMDSQLSEDQRLVLASLCEFDAIWKYDSHFKHELERKSLPSSKVAMNKYLNNNL